MNTGQSPDSPLPPTAPPPTAEKNMDEQPEPAGDAPATDEKKGKHLLTAASALTNLGTSGSNDEHVGKEEISARDEEDQAQNKSNAEDEEDNIPMSFPQRVSALQLVGDHRPNKRLFSH